MRTFLRSKALLVLTFGLLLAVPAVALADNIQDNITDNVSSALNLTAGDANSKPTAEIRVIGNNSAGDPDSGCNFDTSTESVTIAFDTPAGVTATALDGATATPGQMQIATCGVDHTVQFSASSSAAAGNYTVTANIVTNNTGTPQGTFQNQVQIPIKVSAPADTTAPTLNLPADITKEATGANGAAVTYTATADDTNPAHPPVSCTPASGSTFAIGTTTVNCEATDAAGNKATGSFTVTVADTKAPTLAPHDDITGVEATGPDGATVSYTKPNASDAVDPNPTVTCTPASGATFPLGNTTVNCTAKDAAGNESAPSSFTVTVADTKAPTLAPHDDITGVEATGPDGATVSYTKPNASDAVDPSPTVTCTPASGATFPLGNTTVNCTAKDAAGNESAPSSFTVTVVDTTAPALDPHDDVTAEATGPDGATVNYTKPNANDAVDPSPTVTCTPASGATFPLGNTTVSCTAKDAAGNESAAKTFVVKVQDTTKPELTLPDNITEEATGPNGNVVTYSASAEDVVSGSVNVDCTPASGSTFAITTTTVNCSATDAAGNEATGSFTVKVQDTIAPSNIQFVGNINDLDSFFFGSVPNAPTCTATDGGSGLNAAGCVVSGHSNLVGTHTLKATATDKAGNTATKEITYTVKAWTTKGFYSPVDMGSVVNTVKGGSTVPLKFELFAGTTELTDTSAIKFTATKTNCAPNATEDAIEVTATGGTSLRYDSTGGQFIYNWKTPTGAGCYTVTMTAADGSTITAYFKSLK